MKKACFSRIFSVFAPVIALVLAAAVFLPVSCSRQGEAGPAELRYGFASELKTLDPLNPANTADGRSILFNVFEGLVKPDTEGGMRPCIAETVRVEEDGRVYVFRLREDVLFHDGSPLTSADVRFSLETAIGAGFYGLSSIEKIETDGDYGLMISLKNPDREFLPYLTVGIVKAGSVDREKNPVGTGPYYIESYTPQQLLVLRKFKDYRPAGAAELDKVTIVFFENADALIPGLYGGGIDGAGLSGNLAYQIDSDRFDIVPGYSAMVHLLALNNAAPPFDDIRIRQALNFGIDIQEIIDTAFYGWGEPSGSPLIPGLAAYYERSLAEIFPYDAEEALLLLSEAGYSETGQKLSFEIVVPSNYTMHVDTAQVIAAQLARIGVDVSIRLIEWNPWISEVYFGRNFQATIISLDSPVVSPAGFLSRYRSDSDVNFINFTSAAFDRVYDAALAATGEDSRIDLYKEAQRIISAEAASVYIQDILGFRVFRAGAYDGILNYPLSAVDFAAMRKVH